MKIIKTICCILCILFLCSCGHNITHTDRGTGLAVRIPLPDGSSLIDLKVGKIDSTTTVLRGGATYNSSTSTGGSVFGPMGTTEHIQVSTIPQMNEGYIAEVLTSKDCPAEVKIAVAQYLTKQKAPKPAPVSTKTVGAASALGKNPPVADPEQTGWDKVTEEAAEVIKTATPHVTKAASEVSKNASEAVTKSVSSVSSASETWTNNLKVIVAFIVIGLLLLIGIVIFIIIKIKKRKVEVTEKIIEKINPLD